MNKCKAIAKHYDVMLKKSKERDELEQRALEIG